MNREIKERTKWFMDARFGMFIHWGLYSIPACGEWVMSQKEMTIEEYRKYFEQFDPVDYDPKTWVRLAKEAGMKYVVLTAKHHDGFCLFDSKLTDYKATNTKAGRDLVRGFVDACREEGLKVGLYFSIIDWHHPDFPKYGDRQHPMRNNVAYKDEKIDFDRYLDYMHGQVKELVTNYGKLDLLWFDFSYDDMTGEKWKATDLIKMVRHYQPDVIIDNRLEGAGDNHGSIATEHPLIYSGDFASPEQIIPPKGVCDVNGEPIPWELCATMNNHWGYCNFDHQYKTPEMLVRKLVECVSKGGNMILTSVSIAQASCYWYVSADHNGAALQADDLRLEGMRYPVNVHTGSGMALTGTANSTSGSTLEGVQVAILDENDKIVQSAQAQVGGTSFSLKTLDDQIHFGELPTGCYTYMVIVTETSGETLCFASDFTVSDAATSTAIYWSVQDPDGTKLTDQTITATAEETIQSTLGWLSGLFG